MGPRRARGGRPSSGYATDAALSPTEAGKGAKAAAVRARLRVFAASSRSIIPVVTGGKRFELRLQQASNAAVSSVLKIMVDQQTAASTRLRAADLVLTHGAKAIGRSFPTSASSRSFCILLKLRRMHRGPPLLKRRTPTPWAGEGWGRRQRTSRRSRFARLIEDPRSTRK